MAKHIYKKVAKLIKKYDTNCPFKIAQEIGIHILYENLGSVSGYYNKNFQIKIIHINQNANEDEKRFICAHELGHAILHPDANTPFLKKHTFFTTHRIEFEANIFALSLLQQYDFSYLADDTFLFMETDDSKLMSLVKNHIGKIKNHNS